MEMLHLLQGYMRSNNLMDAIRIKMFYRRQRNGRAEANIINFVAYVQFSPHMY